MSDQTSSPDFEKQALGSTIMALTQEGINLRANILALQAENARLIAAEAAQQDARKPAEPAAKLVKA